LTSIVVPSATSWIIASLHSAFGFALIGAVVGEYTGSSRGLGLLIATAQSSFDAAGIYAGMITITVLALAAEWLLTVAEGGCCGARQRRTSKAGSSASPAPVRPPTS
jgi:NitT/TauT family transport system permease protein